MGLFGKLKDGINGVVNSAKEQLAQRQEEEKRRQEEEKRRQEEANRFNPEGKKLEWFSSEDGLTAYSQYITVQNYFLEETAKKEHEAKNADYGLGAFLYAFHKDAKLPFVYFENLVESIGVQVLDYVGPLELLTSALCLQAKPFYIDDDGEPQPRTPGFTPEELVSVEKNPMLNFVKNFNCFELEDDAQGNREDKYLLWSDIVIWLGVYGTDKDTISKNPWIFSKDLYINEMGLVRKEKGFLKKCIGFATDEEQRAYFENKYNECE